MKKKFFVIMSMCALLVLGSSVYAGTTWSEEESRALPGLNKSAYSSTKEKATIGQAGLRMNATEGYEIDVRTKGVSTNTNGGWKRDVKGGNTYAISAPQAVGSTLELHFSSNLFSPTTNIVYEWRSN